MVILDTIRYWTINIQKEDLQLKLFNTSAFTD